MSNQTESNWIDYNSNIPLYQTVPALAKTAINAAYALNAKYPKAHGRVLYNTTDHTVRLVNDNGTFYGNGRATLPSGRTVDYDRKSGHFIFPTSQQVTPVQETTKPKSTSTSTITNGTKPALNAARASVNTRQSPAWYNKFLKSNGQFDISREDLESWANQFGDEATKNYIKGWAGKNTKALWRDKNSGIAQTFQNFTNWVKNNGGESSTSPTLNNNYAYNKEGNSWKFNNSNIGTGVNTTKGTVNPYDSTMKNLTMEAPLILLNSQTPLIDKVNTLTYNRSLTREYMRNRGINPYSYSGAERKALRNYLSGDTTGKNYDINLLKGSELGNKLQLKFQQGGQINMNEQQLQLVFLQYLMLKTGAQNEQQLEQVVLQLGEDGLKQAYAQFMLEMLQQLVQAAKFGAKLNYIKKLNGQCPEGMEMHYYKLGGRLCRKCMQAKQDGGELETPSNPIDAFKCGRKIKEDKKIAKHLQGGSFKLAFDNAYGKLRYFTYNGKVYAAYKGDKATDKGFQGAVDNLQEQADALKDYNAGSHLGWDPGANKHANFRHNASGTMTGVLPEITVTAKRLTSKQPTLTNKSTRREGWDTTAGQSRMGLLASQQAHANGLKYLFGASNPFENMVALTGNGGNWHKDIKTWKDPKTGKSYLYVTRDGINYLSNGRYWNPTTRRGGNYSWSNGWKIFGGGFRHY